MMGKGEKESAQRFHGVSIVKPFPCSGFFSFFTSFHLVLVPDG